jgi:hypothetical protein
LLPQAAVKNNRITFFAIPVSPTKVGAPLSAISAAVSWIPASVGNTALAGETKLLFPDVALAGFEEQAGELRE